MIYFKIFLWKNATFLYFALDKKPKNGIITPVNNKHSKTHGNKNRKSRQLCSWSSIFHPRMLLFGVMLGPHNSRLHFLKTIKAGFIPAFFRPGNSYQHDRRSIPQKILFHNQRLTKKHKFFQKNCWKSLTNTIKVIKCTRATAKGKAPQPVKHGKLYAVAWQGKYKPVYDAIKGVFTIQGNVKRVRG